MAIDTKLLNAIKERRYNPWLKEGRVRQNYATYLPNPDIDEIRSVNLYDEAVWLGVDLGFYPDPTAIVIVKVLMIESSYFKPGCINKSLGDCFVTPVYRVVQATELSGMEYPRQRDEVQRIIDQELNHGNSVRLAVDSTGVGVAVAQDWQQGLNHYDDFIPVTIVSGQPRKLKNKSVSDLLISAMNAFSEGRIGLPKTSDFTIRKLKVQLVTRGIDTDFRGRLKAIDERSQSMSHYDLAVALSLVVGHIEHSCSRFVSLRVL